MADLNYRQEQVNFVTGHTGSPWWTVLAVLCQLPVLIIILKAWKCGLVFQILLLSTYPVLTVTLLAELCIESLGMLSTVAVVSIFVGKLLDRKSASSATIHDKKIEAQQEESSSSNSDSESRVRMQYAFLTHFRGATLLTTILAILAVDFKAFPRYFAKTEAYGVSLMDMGTGMFIVSTGLTSRFARQGHDRSDGVSDTSGGYICSYQRWAVFLLGMGRLITLKALSYHEHVSEYGVHWNFFVTIFFVWTIVDLMRGFFRANDILLVAISLALIVGYQSYLVQPEVLSFVLEGERSNFFAANREGILSLCAYVPMFLISEIFSRHFIFNLLSSNTHTARTRWFRALLFSLGLSLICSISFFIADEHIQPISRRLTNAAFIMFVIAISFFVIALLISIDLLFEDTFRPLSSLQSLSANQLIVFLVANLMTGMVNIVMQTIYASREIAIMILFLYMLLLLIGINFYYWKDGISVDILSSKYFRKDIS